MAGGTTKTVLIIFGFVFVLGGVCSVWVGTPSPDDPATPQFDPLDWDWFCVGTGVTVIALGAVMAVYGLRMREVPRYPMGPMGPYPYAVQGPWAPAQPVPPPPLAPPAPPPPVPPPPPEAPEERVPCTTCGRDIPRGAGFCSQCGAPQP